jgi:hypothetical protein
MEKESSHSEFALKVSHLSKQCTQCCEAKRLKRTHIMVLN